MYLDDFKIEFDPLKTSVSAGVGSKRIVARGRQYRHSIPTNTLSRIVVNIEGRYDWFRCQVGLDDSIPAFKSSADFIVIADGRASAVHAISGQPLQDFAIDLTGVQKLELCIHSNHAIAGQALWFDPQIGAEGEEYLLRCAGAWRL